MPTAIVFFSAATYFLWCPRGPTQTWWIIKTASCHWNTAEARWGMLHCLTFEEEKLMFALFRIFTILGLFFSLRGFTWSWSTPQMFNNYTTSTLPRPPPHTLDIFFPPPPLALQGQRWGQLITIHFLRFPCQLVKRYRSLAGCFDRRICKVSRWKVSSQHGCHFQSRHSQESGKISSSFVPTGMLVLIGGADALFFFPQGMGRPLCQLENFEIQ